MQCVARADSLTLVFLLFHGEHPLLGKDFSPEQRESLVCVCLFCFPVLADFCPVFHGAR
jgi:hypothetical protein